MDNSSRYFLELLAAFINKRKPQKPDSINWNRIYELSKLHSLSGAIYLSMKELPVEYLPEHQIRECLKSAFYSTVLRAENQEALITKIAGQLSKKGIRHICIKGAVIKRLYPVPQMRTLGDIDLMVQSVDRNAVDNALREIGCSMKYSSGHEEKYYYKDLAVETHYQVINDYIKRNSNNKAYFNHMWEHSYHTGSGCTYELDAAYHLIYLFSHMAKHLYNQGCGIRILMDVTVMLKHYGSGLDFIYILTELKKINLDQFARNIISICVQYFELPDLITRVDQEELDSEAAMDYFLKGGTFGMHNNSIYSYLVRHELEKTDHSGKAQLRAVIRKIFPELDMMQGQYKILIGCPVLLPAFWAIRGIRCILFRRKITLKILKELRATEDVKRDYFILRKLGLKF